MKYLFSKNLAFLRKKSGKTQTDIGLQLKKAHTSIGNWEKGISEPSLTEIEDIARIFDISVIELLTKDLSEVSFDNKSVVDKIDTKGKVSGKISGKISQNLNDSNSDNQMVAEPAISYVPKVVTVDSRGDENMVLVPVKAAAGYLNGYGDSAFIQSLPAYRLPGYNNGIYRMFEVAGLSMHPTLNDGDLLITRSVETLDGIVNDRIHVVVTANDGIVVKRVLNRVKTDNKLILKSDNVKDRHEYPNMVIHPTEVREIWFVVAYISRIMKSPTEMYERMIDLEGRLTILEHNQKKLRL